MQRSFDDAFSSGEVEIETREECCFGALYDGAALPITGGGWTDRSSSGDFVFFDVCRKEGYHILRWPNSTDDYAVLDSQSSSRLQVIDHDESVRFEALVEAAALGKKKKGTKTKPAPVGLSINIYGTNAIAKDIGCKLSAESAFLQHPKALPQEIRYDNPQLFDFPEDETDMQALVGITNDSPAQQRAKISDEILSILDCLSEAPGPRNSNSICPDGLLSQLKPHQEQGVRFIINREAEHLYGQSMSNQKHDTCLPTNCGGIVADAMGLGKTLTVLTSILQSTSAAEVFRRFDRTIDFQNGEITRTKATLVVVSSAQLLDNWRAEIERHFAPEAFNTIVFHGPNRLQDPNALASANIVLTTYATIVAEEKGRSVLQKLRWFRIVLDEGHWIRNLASKQFKSVASLSARNRWCLTGTPIQNKLDDIAALAAFLQMQPFPTKASFQEGVLDPLSQAGKGFSKPLRSWLRAVCIRRTEKLLKLPDSTEETVLVTMSQEEKQLYDLILRQSKHEIDDIVSKGKSIKKYNILFAAILKMRMLCDCGTFSKTANSQKPLADEAKEIGCEQCATSNDEDAALLLTTFQFCPDCGRSLQIASPGSNLGSNRGRDSPLPGYFPVTSEISSLSTGHSAKLSAVMKRIRASGSESKHIVFSYWTSTLDLLSSLLDNAAMSYLQVDGRTSYTERSRRLQKFRENYDTPVLLMSIETGALGLNLTAANYVHIVEPQWNPSVEEQAVARALRMGQTRKVSVLRYVVGGSVEQNIMHLQKRKKTVAKFMFNVGAAEELDGKLEDLKFVLDLNSASIPSL